MGALYTQFDNSLEINETPLLEKGNKIVKRTVDVMISLTVIIVVLPFAFIVVALCLKVWMPGPVFFKQKRTGKDGKIFECYKFRTMDARNHSDKFVDPQMNEYALGNFLRNTSIDELPQFWNVLRGDMSIIGPRPHMLVHDEEYSAVIPEYPLRYAVKIGRAHV